MGICNQVAEADPPRTSGHREDVRGGTGDPQGHLMCRDQHQENSRW